ncbi:Hexose phosphate uptake regulatory protein UhpC [Minicystis rosea]|nr:Hexose phosphate uptake regulatory protein UhpC [Minicystis rosea]
MSTVAPSAGHDGKRTRKKGPAREVPDIGRRPAPAVGSIFRGAEPTLRAVQASVALRPVDASQRRSTFWTLLLGYGAYYLCRANLGVAAPLLQEDLHLDKVQIGAISGIATLFYALGKLTLGPFSDLLGGRRIFLLGLAGAALANTAFGFSGALTVMIVVWSFNRFVQSAGWMGLVQLVSQWYDRHQYGVVMALLSLSFQLGDVAARAFSSGILRLGGGWRSLFFAPAAVVTVFLLVAMYTIHVPTPRIGTVSEPVETADEGGETAARLRGIFGLLLRSRGFWMSCVLSFLLTFLRTVFLDWTVLFLVESGTATWKATLHSAVFPITGAAGTLFAGWYSDRVSRGRRGPIAALMLGLLVVAMMVLAYAGASSTTLALICIGASGFLLLGPYSLLGGALALDYGGKRAAATAAGISDGVGYLGGSASGLALGGVVQAYGWRTAFLVLAVCSAISFAVAAVFAWSEDHGRVEPAR